MIQTRANTRRRPQRLAAFGMVAALLLVQYSAYCVECGMTMGIRAGVSEAQACCPGGADHGRVGCDAMDPASADGAKTGSSDAGPSCCQQKAAVEDREATLLADSSDATQAGDMSTEPRGCDCVTVVGLPEGATIAADAPVLEQASSRFAVEVEDEVATAQAWTETDAEGRGPPDTARLTLGGDAGLWHAPAGRSAISLFGALLI